MYFADRFRLVHKPYVLKMRNGISYSVMGHTDNAMMVEEIWHRAPYDMALRHIKNGSTIVEIGASIGIVSVKMAKSAKDVKVVACEPIGAAAERNRENMALNGSPADVRTVAASGHSGRLTLWQLPLSTGASSDFVPNCLPVEVDCVSFDDLLKDIPSVDLLKCDCDGSEEDVFYNASPENMAKVGAIVMEWHDYVSKKGMPAFMDFLRSHGFQPEFLGTDTNVIYAPRDRR